MSQANDLKNAFDDVKNAYDDVQCSLLKTVFAGSDGYHLVKYYLHSVSGALLDLESAMGTLDSEIARAARTKQFELEL